MTPAAQPDDMTCTEYLQPAAPRGQGRKPQQAALELVAPFAKMAVMNRVACMLDPKMNQFTKRVLMDALDEVLKADALARAPLLVTYLAGACLLRRHLPPTVSC
ncbi:hypothetical protein HYH03_015177 [Edaphochlamys debaryana]|uniref:Uncharacterized protein n=1 Tax=Edaphochlamys debaryana TaxID=47281 RepID=A0A835XSP9_9CHLO|nr:hypothetical protein HYH03_015177 [Edaphochlamys debaryana]|eukprot:KAG2486215.1 hypothetical protein HYH03_015177 [Edaphochlamys debaryana]